MVMNNINNNSGNKLETTVVNIKGGGLDAYGRSVAYSNENGEISYASAPTDSIGIDITVSVPGFILQKENRSYITVTLSDTSKYSKQDAPSNHGCGIYKL